MTTRRWTTVIVALGLLAACRGGASSEADTSETGVSSATESSATESSGESVGDSTVGDGDPTTGDGDPTSGDGDGDPGDGDGDPGGTKFDMITPDLGEPEPTNPLWASAHLWYTIDDKLIYIELDPADGSVTNLVVSTIQAQPALLQGFAGITMLLDDQDEIDILITRVTGNSTSTSMHRIHAPPTDGSPVNAELLGVVPDDLLIEALYTDCEGRVYLMDTGPDVSSAAGNRLIRLTGDYLAGDLSYEVITDLQNASVADIDDMGPGIDAMGEITDGQGFAIDSGSVHDFDYNTGTGMLLGMAGTYGVHALGGPLFDDSIARLYVLDIDANLFEADPETLSLSPILVTGPDPAANGVAGWSGLTGPLTECTSTLPEPQ